MSKDGSGQRSLWLKMGVVREDCGQTWEWPEKFVAKDGSDQISLWLKMGVAREACG